MGLANICVLITAVCIPTFIVLSAVGFGLMAGSNCGGFCHNPMYLTGFSFVIVAGVALLIFIVYGFVFLCCEYGPCLC